ncbi:hypothetical protein [Hoeflea poritis]|uniref:Uncharacterized protein n=1 Tax=Hoeflea poritis TaxID=2993659 RepID=A0ABT4VMP1_9HYPH|nr:hypothetical protein [Hoeflea poritis]MDA4845935.1 hypothetical protein [Hoeflea poritis]
MAEINGELIERVARAIADTECQWPDYVDEAAKAIKTVFEYQDENYEAPQREEDYRYALTGKR